MTHNRRRYTAALLTALILCFVLISLCAVVLEATHDCSGEDCDICRVLSSLTAVIRTLTCAAAVSSVIAAADMLRRSRLFSASSAKQRATPVSDKVRLLN